MKVKKIMSADPAFCSPEDTLTKGALLMFQRDCGAIPVVDEAGNVVGIVTDRDISVAVASRNQKASEIRMGELSGGEIFTCSPDDDVEDAVKLMGKRQVRRLPVVAEKGALQGILTVADIVTAAGGKKKPVSLKKVFKLIEAVSKKAPIVLMAAVEETAAGEAVIEEKAAEAPELIAVEN